MIAAQSTPCDFTFLLAFLRYMSGATFRLGSNDNYRYARCWLQSKQKCSWMLLICCVSCLMRCCASAKRCSFFVGSCFSCPHHLINSFCGSISGCCLLLSPEICFTSLCFLQSFDGSAAGKSKQSPHQFQTYITKQPTFGLRFEESVVV